MQSRQASSLRALLIPLPVLLLFGGCSVTPDRDVRAFNTCLMRHAQDAAVCDAPLQAYELDVPTLAATSLPSAGLGQ
jgi:hypothetical protein